MAYWYDFSWPEEVRLTTSLFRLAPVRGSSLNSLDFLDLLAVACVTTKELVLILDEVELKRLLVNSDPAQYVSTLYCGVVAPGEQ